MKKKIFFVIALAIIGMMSYAGVTKSSTSETKDCATTNVQDVCYKVSVCKITQGSGTMTIKNHSFTGEYDTNDDYIKIYDKSGSLVKSGTPERSDRSGFSHRCGVYYFNL